MNTIASTLLLLLGIIAFQNYRQGTLSQWLAAKFLNADTGPAAAGARKGVSTLPKGTS